MKEIVELSKSQMATSISELQAVFFKKEGMNGIELLLAGPSHFSKELTGNEFIQRKVVVAEPFRLCSLFKTPVEKVHDRILVVERGDCTFIEKARKGQKAGAAAIIVNTSYSIIFYVILFHYFMCKTLLLCTPFIFVQVVDNVPGSNSDEQPMFAMSGDGVDDVIIPCVFLYSRESDILIKAITNNPNLEVYKTY